MIHRFELSWNGGPFFLPVREWHYSTMCHFYTYCYINIYIIYNYRNIQFLPHLSVLLFLNYIYPLDIIDVMNVVIIGAGRRGLRLAKHLIEENKNVIFLDSNTERCQQAVSKLDCLAVCGSATDVDKLIEAQVSEADAVIAVTDNDETNLVSCGIVASEFPQVKTTIAAIRSISYLGKGSHHPILGISYIVNPDQEAANRIIGIIRSGLYKDVISFPDAHFMLFATSIKKDSPFKDKTLIEARKQIPGQYVIAGIRRKNKVFTPYGDSIIKVGDEIAIIVDEEESKDIFTELSGPIDNSRIKRMLLIGATRITRYLLSSFTSQERRKVTLIERDEKIAREFLDLFPDILIINASVTDEAIWDDEKLYDSDLVISVTENDELNIITSLYAKRLGAKRVIALIKTNNNYIQLASHLDIDAAISTTNATVDTLVKHLRGSTIETLHSLFDGALEVYEFVIGKDFRYLNKALKDVNLKGKVIIAGIKRGDGENFIPGGNYSFTLNDTVIVAAAHRDQQTVQELFGANA